MRKIILLYFVFISVQVFAENVGIEVCEHAKQDKSAAEVEQLVIISEAKYNIGNAERIIEKATTTKKDAEETVKKLEKEIQNGSLNQEKAKTDKAETEAAKIKAEEDIKIAHEAIQRAVVVIAAAEETLIKEGKSIDAEDTLLQSVSAKIEMFRSDQKIAENDIVLADAAIYKVEEEKKEAEVNKQKTVTITFPNCKNLYISRGAHNPCPSGYDQILYSDMVWSVEPNLDDIYLCQKDASAVGNLECLTGYLVRGIHAYSDDCRIQSSTYASVPRGTHARLRFSDLYGSSLVVTILNRDTRCCATIIFAGWRQLRLPVS